MAPGIRAVSDDQSTFVQNDAVSEEGKKEECGKTVNDRTIGKRKRE